MASLLTNIAPAYNSTTGAKAGKWYTNGNKLYMCTKDCTGAFNAANFIDRYLSDLMTGNSNLGGNGYTLSFTEYVQNVLYDVLTLDVTNVKQLEWKNLRLEWNARLTVRSDTNVTIPTTGIVNVSAYKTLYFNAVRANASSDDGCRIDFSVNLK